MATQRRKVTLLNAATTASAVGSAEIDYRFETGGTQRLLFGTLTSGAEINLYIYPDAEHTIEHLEAKISIGSSSYTTATNSFLEVLNGPFHSMEVRKAGSSGTATVIAIV